MDNNHTFLSATLTELTRRKVLRTVGGYAVAVFVLLQLMDAAVEPLRLPDWLPTLVVIVVILGFPVIFMLAWLFDITAKGVTKTPSAGILSRPQSTVLFSIMLFATAGLGYVFYEYYSGVFATELHQSPAQGETLAQRAFSAPKNSIAVLPFADLSAAKDQAYFSDGVAEEILNVLAQVKDLHVAARTSSFAFRDPQSDIREIGRLLNVSTVLEGSIRTSGNRIRLTAQLINVADGYHIWSQSYDRELDDIFAIQDEIASSIADALVDSFAGLEIRETERSDSLAASQAYRTGRLHWWRRTAVELQKAIELFAQALEHDPQFAPAYAALADTRLLLARYGNIASVKAIEKAQPMIEKALAIDPQSAEAFAALGLARWQIGQLDAAESALRQSMQLNVNYIPAQLWLAGILSQQGRYPEVDRILQQAMSLDPLNELLAANYSANLAVRGDWESARSLLQDLVDLRPTSSLLLRSMAAHELNHGGLTDGWRLANRAYRLETGNPEDISIMFKAWLTLGQIDEAEQVLQAGMEKLDQNESLQHDYWSMLVWSNRLEEAKSLTNSRLREAGDQLTPVMQRKLNYQQGMIAMREGKYEAAFRLFSGISESRESNEYSEADIMTLTLTAMVADRSNHPEESAQYLEQAELKVQKARLNGVDDPSIYYAEATILALRDDPEAAMTKLELAYEKGFRELWFFNTDGRLDGLRNEPSFTALRDRIQNDIDHSVAEIRSVQVGAG